MVPLVEKLADVNLETFFTSLQTVGTFAEELAVMLLLFLKPICFSSLE